VPLRDGRLPAICRRVLLQGDLLPAICRRVPVQHEN
jgi:hypothetical protein